MSTFARPERHYPSGQRAGVVSVGVGAVVGQVAEGRITTVPNLGTTYVYDAEGRRAAIVASTGSGSCGTPPQIYYIFDLADHVVSQQCPGGRMREEFYAAGRHLVNYGLLVTFMHPDWLGTEHYRTEANGSAYGQCVNGPFGDQMYCGEADGDYSPVHFTAKERDGGNTLSPTNLDNFGARFYSSNMARFMSPDWALKPIAVPYANFGNPQSLNLYSYVENNPETLVDTDGHEIIYADNLKNAQLVKDSVQAILANPHTSGNLSGYVGPNNPNLTIQSGDLSAGDTRTVLPSGQTLTTTVQGNTAPDIQTSTVTSNGVTSAPETILTGATITIDNRTSKGDTPGVLYTKAFMREKHKPIRLSSRKMPQLRSLFHTIKDRKSNGPTRHNRPLATRSRRK